MSEERKLAAGAHRKLLLAYHKWLDGEELTAAQATAIAKYLQANQIDLPSDAEAHKALARKFLETLPFSDPEEA